MKQMTFGKTIIASCLAYILASLVLGGIFAVIVVGMIIGGLSEEEKEIPDNAVLEIVLSDGLVEQVGGGFLGINNAPSLRALTTAIRAAGTDDRIRGIVIRADRVRGNGSQLLELRRALVEFKASKKFILATIGEGGVSEWEYLLATAADSIYSHPIAEIEMNGFVTAIPYFKTAMDRLGVKAEVFRSGRYKSAVEPFLLDSASEDSRENINSIITDIFGRFKRVIIDSRHITIARLDAVLDSISILRSTDAQANGLVDVVAYPDEFDNMLRKKLKLDSSAAIPFLDIEDYLKGGGVEEASGPSQIAIVYADGEITGGESRFDSNPLFGSENTVGSVTFSEAMREVRESKAVRAVVIRINSPGGLMSASDAMWRDVVLTRKAKPVIVSMGNLAASGGYYIAAPADTIVADSSTLTGSIGVFGLMFNTKELMKGTLGINIDLIKTNPHADLMSGDRDLTPQERQMIQNMVDASYERFLEVVSLGRGMSRDSVHQIAQGRVWTGVQAKRIGLVDELGGLDRAIEIARDRARIPPSDLGFRILPRPRSFLERFLSEMGRAGQVLGETKVSPRDLALSQLNTIRNWSGIQLRAPGLVIH